MKTLQRLRHIRPPSSEQLNRCRVEEARLVSQEERLRWLRVLKRMALWIVLAGAAVGTGYWIMDLGSTADGIVQANLVVVRAPATVRIAEVFCEPGQHCKKGDPLLRLSSLGGEDARRALEMMVQKRRLRKALVEAGGNLDAVDLSRRGELVAEADREASLATAEYKAALARLKKLINERDTFLIKLQMEDQKNFGQVASLEERLSEAEALVEAAHAEKRIAEFDAEKNRNLEASGLMPLRDVLEAESKKDASHKKVESLNASARALQNEKETAEEIWDLEKERAEAALFEVNTRIEEAWCETEATRLRRDLWQELAERRKKLFSSEPVDENRLREIELELLEVEVAEAEALLGKLDRELGNITVRAEFDGIIDQVHVAGGDVVDATTPLASYFDPSKQWVTAYVTPDLAGEDLDGRACTLVPEGDCPSLEGRVASMGWVWVPCPPQIPERSGSAVDYRLPVRIECRGEADLKSFRLNTRMKVVFAGADE